MNRATTKDELLALVSQGLVDVEEAINQHPGETVSLYQNGKRAFSEGQTEAKETEWSRSAGLSLQELALIHQYLFASAFISAWHDVQKDKVRRDQATSPACLLVAGLGFSHEDVLHRFRAYELVWRTALKPKRRWFW